MQAIDTILEAICPALFNSASKDVFVDMATTLVSDKYFGNSYNQAVAYVACHLFTQFSIETGSTPDISNATSLSEGGLSVGFASLTGAYNTVADAPWATTKYGKMYLALRKMGVRFGVNNAGLTTAGGLT